MKLASPSGGSGDPVESFSGEPVVLEVTVSRPSATVQWLLDGREIQAGANVAVSEDGLIRRLTILSPTPGDSGKYTCDAVNDAMDFQVKVTGKTKQNKIKRLLLVMVMEDWWKTTIRITLHIFFNTDCCGGETLSLCMLIIIIIN